MFLRTLAPALAALAASFGAAAPANAAMAPFTAYVESVTGENLSTGLAPGLLPGAAFNLVMTIDEGVPIADLFNGGGGLLQASLQLGGGYNALIQNCCVSAFDTDISDGEISLTGGLGGFTGPDSDGFGIFAGQFTLRFSVDAADIPGGGLATSDDLIALLAAASIVIDGDVEGVLIDQMFDRPTFSQTVNFTTAEIPLPGAIWVFAAGAGLIAAGRRGRWNRGGAPVSRPST